MDFFVLRGTVYFGFSTQHSSLCFKGAERYSMIESIKEFLKENGWFASGVLAILVAMILAMVLKGFVTQALVETATPQRNYVIISECLFGTTYHVLVPQSGYSATVGFERADHPDGSPIRCDVKK